MKLRNIENKEILKVTKEKTDYLQRSNNQIDYIDFSTVSQKTVRKFLQNDERNNNLQPAKIPYKVWTKLRHLQTNPKRTYD